MKEILLKLKKAYLKRVSHYKTKEGYIVKNGCFGLCNVCFSDLTIIDYILFKEYLRENTKRRKIYYNCDGVRVRDNNQFLWNPTDIQARLDWLDKQISKLE